jgi:hypothetical protein
LIGGHGINLEPNDSYDNFDFPETVFFT